MESNQSTVIETTLGALEAASPALRRVSDQEGLSAKAKYHVAKLAKLVAAETKIFAEQREQLYRELSVERDARTPAERAQFGPTVREVPAASLPAFQERLTAIMDVPVTIAWAPIRSVDLPNAKASDLVDLGPLCELVEPT